jgi:hypothetical protein
MEYCYITVPTGVLVSSGEKILIVCKCLENSQFEGEALVREVVDFDVLGLVCEDDDEYQVIVRNSNYDTYSALETVGSLSIEPKR